MRKNYFDIPISIIEKEQLLFEVIEKGKSREGGFLCALNAHMTAESQHNLQLKEALVRADWVVTDGAPVAWAVSHFLGRKQDRIAGMDITPELLSRMEQAQMTLSVYGNTDENLDKFRSYVTEHHPGLKIGALISPPFRPLTREETQGYLEELNNSGTHILFTSLGCPKQEIWMSKHLDEFNFVAMGIGNAINTVVGTEKRAPQFLQKVGMEWFYRFIQNPKRLFKRYFMTNTHFLFLVARQKFRKA